MIGVSDLFFDFCPICGKMFTAEDAVLLRFWMDRHTILCHGVKIIRL